jgi:hypothetical protein
MATEPAAPAEAAAAASPRSGSALEKLQQELQHLKQQVQTNVAAHSSVHSPVGSLASSTISAPAAHNTTTAATPAGLTTITGATATAAAAGDNLAAILPNSATERLIEGPAELDVEQLASISTGGYVSSSDNAYEVAADDDDEDDDEASFEDATPSGTSRRSSTSSQVLPAAAAAPPHEALGIVSRGDSDLLYEAAQMEAGLPATTVIQAAPTAAGAAEGGLEGFISRHPAAAGVLPAASSTAAQAVQPSASASQEDLYGNAAVSAVEAEVAEVPVDAATAAPPAAAPAQQSELQSFIAGHPAAAAGVTAGGSTASVPGSGEFIPASSEEADTLIGAGSAAPGSVTGPFGVQLASSVNAEVLPSSEDIDTAVGSAQDATAGPGSVIAHQQQQQQPLLSVGSSRLADVLNRLNTHSGEQQAAAEGSGEWLHRSLSGPGNHAASAASAAATAAARVGGVLASSSLGVLQLVESTAVTPTARRSAVQGIAAAAGLGTTAAAAGLSTTAAAAAGGAALLPAVVGFTGSTLLWSARQMAAAAQGTANAAVNAALFLPRTALWAASSITGSSKADKAPATAAATAATPSAMPKLPARSLAKGTGAAAGPAASVAVTVSAAPGSWSVLGALRLMFWQLPWSVAVASLTAWSWLLTQMVPPLGAPAAALLSLLTQPAAAAVTPTSTAAEEGQAVGDILGQDVGAAAGVGAAEAEVHHEAAESPRVGSSSMRWLLRGRPAATQVPPTPAPSLEVRAVEHQQQLYSDGAVMVHM